jgi:hypothetical protein
VIDSDRDVILYVHGYNMPEDEKQRWIETTYKRLAHLGYQGRVAGFTWPCTQSALTFDSSELRAWESGEKLMQLLASYKNAGYRVHLLAHSQGNVVTGEALRLWKASGNSAPLVSSYVASQAAVAAHTYDAAAELIPGFAGSITDSGTPNVYVNYPMTSRPYHSSTDMAGTAGRFVNFQNPVDWALTGNSFNPTDPRPGWHINQRLKPDLGFGWNSEIGFYSGTSAESVPTVLGFPSNRFEIFAFAAEARSKALGSTVTQGVFSNQNFNLQSAMGYGNEHKWHSAQFRGGLSDRVVYWQQLLLNLGLVL